MLNKIWAFFIIISVIFAILGKKLDIITTAIFSSGDNAIKLCIELLPGMCFFCGLLRVAKSCGIIEKLAVVVKPLVSKLFPEIPMGNPSISLMITNIFSNIFGAGNAATALGINAMKELDKLNPKKEEASDAMCMFIILNTCTIALFPSGIIALRYAAGSMNPAGIITETMIVSGLLCLFGIIMCKIFAKNWR
jgi:spore maturation protein A